MDDLYLDTIIDRYRHPTNFGWIEAASEMRKARNASCGDSFEVSLLFEGGKVAQAKWRGQGCAISTVSVDTFCEWAVGKTSKQLTMYSKQQIQELTEIDTITSAREKCLYLPLTLAK